MYIVFIKSVIHCSVFNTQSQLVFSQRCHLSAEHEQRSLEARKQQHPGHNPLDLVEPLSVTQPERSGR